MNINSNTPISIYFDGRVDGKMMMDAEALLSLINSNKGVNASGESTGVPDQAKPELITTIAIVGAVTGFASLVLQAIDIWRQDRPNYTITVSEPDLTYTVNNLSREEYLNKVRQLRATSIDTRISVSIRENNDS